MSRNTDYSPANIFQLVSDPSEKMKIFYDLIKTNQEVVVKPVNLETDVYSVKPHLIQGSELHCSSQSMDQFHQAGTELIAQFQVNGQKFISQVHFKVVENSLILLMEKKLFRVQRREFFRLRLPHGFRGTLFVPELFGAPFKQSFHLIDLSGGGCKIEMPPLDLKLKAGTVFKGVIKLPERAEMPVVCTVRHEVKLNGRPDARWLGIEFFHQSEPERNRLAATVMDLYRELFSRL